MNRSIAYSVVLLLRDTVRHWLFFVGGATASLAGWVLQARGANLPTAWFVYAGGALMVVALVRAWHDVRLERDQLRDEKAPKFKIVFLPDGEPDSRPYLQTLTHSIEVPIKVALSGQSLLSGNRERTIAITTRDMLDRRYRVGIVNLGSGAISNVSLTLESCDPPGNFIHPGHHLLVMDSDPRQERGELSPSADGKPTMFFDIVNEHGPADSIPYQFMFCYANERLVGAVDPRSYEIVLRADGGNVSATKRFRVWKPWTPNDGPGRLMMEEIAEAPPDAPAAPLRS